MILWSAEELLTATAGQCSIKNWTASGVSIDTRTLKKGDLFIAISGNNFDANDFIKSAYEKGASGAIVSRFDPTVSIPQIIVDNTEQALRGLAVYARSRLQGEIIGITGSVGKTSVKDSLCKVLEKYGTTYATEGNLNNHYGVPLTLSRIAKNTQYAIIEMGMSSLGEIHDLTMLTRPTCAIVNTVEKAHLEFFTGIEQIAEAKSEIFDGLSHGVAIYNADTNCTDILQQSIDKKSLKHFTFGTKKDSNLQLLSTTQHATHQIVYVSSHGVHFNFTISALGHHRASNACAVLSILACIGIDPAQACHHLKDITPTIGRGASASYPINGGNVLVYDESYNGAPISMHASLQVLGDTPCKGRRIAVLGDMLELGKDSVHLHKQLKQSILENSIDTVFACGENMKHLFDCLPIEKQGYWAKNSDLLSEIVLQSLLPNDILVIKGSAGSKMKLIASKIAGDL